jgi:hypothetical protein
MLSLSNGIWRRRASGYDVNAYGVPTLDLNADTVASVGDAGSVTGWTNSGSVATTFSPGASSTRPVYRANGIASGVGAVDFDGTDDYAASAALLSAFVGDASAWTATVVANLDGMAAENVANPWNNAAFWIDVGGFLSMGVGRVGGVANLIVWLWTTSAQFVRVPCPEPGTAFVAQAWYTGTSLNARVNGGATTTLVCAKASNRTFAMRVGRYGTGANDLNGNVRRNLVWNTTLSAAGLDYHLVNLAAEAKITL